MPIMRLRTKEEAASISNNNNTTSTDTTVTAGVGDDDMTMGEAMAGEEEGEEGEAGVNKRHPDESRSTRKSTTFGGCATRSTASVTSKKVQVTSTRPASSSA